MKKLWKGGFGDFETFVVADDLGEALEKVRNKLNMHALPVVAECIDNVEGYIIIAIDEKELPSENESVSEEPKEELPEQELPFSEEPEEPKETVEEPTPKRRKK